MKGMIRWSLDHSRTIIFLLCCFVLFGLYSYVVIPKESTPDVKIPLIYVNIRHDGISPEDAERLLLRPMEQQLRTLEGLDEVRSTAYEGGGSVVVKFQAGLNIEKAKNDVRDKVDTAKPELPAESKEPEIFEINLSQFPVLLVKLAGDIPERALFKFAKDAKDAIEAGVSSVLKAEIVGDKEDLVEILIDPVRLDAYKVPFDQLLAFFGRNNQMISAGSIDNGHGRFSVKVPGVIENVYDIMEMPLVANGDSVVHLKDVAEIRRTFKDIASIARDRGVSCVIIEVSKRTGEHLIDTIDGVKKVMSEISAQWPKTVKIDYAQDESKRIKDMLRDLQNNIIMAIILVMLVIAAALGWRSSLLVGIALPGSFLIGIFSIFLMGYTLNMIVLFSLIFSVGMLVDGAIIVVEYADRKIAEGLSPKAAYLEGAQRMCWPVITSTLTILVVFLPLLFWPGVIGQFMKFLPITLLMVLTASIFMALIFVPTIGGILKPRSVSESDKVLVAATEGGDLEHVSGFTGKYLKFLNIALDHPKRVLWGAVILLIVIKTIHGIIGRGVEFFPEVEPDLATIHVYARGNLSTLEKSKIVKLVEDKILSMKELESIYARIGKQKSEMESVSEDVVGIITLEFVDWQERRLAQDIIENIEKEIHTIPGIYTEVRKKKPGPPASKPIIMELSSYDPEKIIAVFPKLKEYVLQLSGIKAVEDDRSVPGITWELVVDRAQAAKFGADITSVGAVIRMATNGAVVGKYRPSDVRDEVDIALRFFPEYRHLAQFDNLKVNTINGSVPLSLFVDRYGKERVGELKRADGKRIISIKADVAPGVLVLDKVKEIKNWIKTNLKDSEVTVNFKGEEKDRLETGAFLIKAFFVAILMIALILVTQFNSFFSMGLVLSAVVLSTVGVFVGLIVHQLAFGVVMGGIGMIALAGIIVSNNIILIDTFDILKRGLTEMPTLGQIREVILRTCVQRLRPVILTKLTTILGLLPIMFGINIDFIKLEVSVGAPATQWWVLLSTCIVYGVLFASSLTLFVTPCALYLRELGLLKKRTS